jgi:hypothetical protein
MELRTIRRGTAPLLRRNLLLTIDVRPFLSIPADTPHHRTKWCGAGTRSNRQWNRLCGDRRTDILFGGMMPFGKIEKSLHEGR